MTKRVLYFILFLAMNFLISCQTSYDRIEQKNKCFSEKLIRLKSSKLYNTVFSSFKDTFAVLKENKENFGISSYVDTKIDDAIFFKKDSAECILIVLEKMKDTMYVFGAARIIRGVSIHGNWKFEVSLSVDFDKGYFKDYKENSFENISRLARYGVLVGGNANKSGCEISEKYWFYDLKR